MPQFNLNDTSSGNLVLRQMRDQYLAELAEQVQAQPGPDYYVAEALISKIQQIQQAIGTV